MLTTYLRAPRIELRPFRAFFRGAFLAGWVVLGLSLSHADDLASRLQPRVDSFAGEAAVMVKHLETGETFEYRASDPFPTASLSKFPIMIAAYDVAQKGKLSLDQKITLQSEDKVPGSGILTSNFSAGATISLRDAIQLMIAFSDNTATNLVIDAIGLEATNNLMKSLARIASNMRVVTPNDCPGASVEA